MTCSRGAGPGYRRWLVQLVRGTWLRRITQECLVSIRRMWLCLFAMGQNTTCLSARLWEKISVPRKPRLCQSFDERGLLHRPWLQTKEPWLSTAENTPLRYFHVTWKAILSSGHRCGSSQDRDLSATVRSDRLATDSLMAANAELSRQRSIEAIWARVPLHPSSSTTWRDSGKKSSRTRVRARMKMQHAKVVD